jgi:hypothetical protein
MPRRRAFLKASGTALLTGGLVGTAAGAEDRGYRVVTEAPNPVGRTVVLQDQIAYTSNRQGMVTIDFSDPHLPVPLAAVPARGETNNDVKVSGDVAGAANDGDPGGVTLFDVSDPAAPQQRGFYSTPDGVHNHDVQDGYAYVCVSNSEEASFSEARIDIVDLSDLDEPTKVAEWRLRDHYPEMALAGTNPAHDVYVQDGLAYVPFWDAGTVVVDVSEPTDPVAVAHVGALEDADVRPRSTAEFYSRYIGAPGNDHFAMPTPDGEHLFVGAETYPDPTGTAIPERHGGVQVYDLGDLNLSSPIATAAQDGQPVDPTAPDPIAYIAAPEEPRYGALRCSHNFDFNAAGTEFYCSWYQGGIRAYDVADRSSPEEVGSFVSPDGQPFWRAANLPHESGNYTLGAERDGKGIVVLELVEGGSTVSSPSAAAVEAARPSREEVFGSLSPSTVDR